MPLTSLAATKTLAGFSQYVKEIQRMEGANGDWKASVLHWALPVNWWVSSHWEIVLGGLLAEQVTGSLWAIHCDYRFKKNNFWCRGHLLFSVTFSTFFVRVLHLIWFLRVAYWCDPDLGCHLYGFWMFLPVTVCVYSVNVLIPSNITKIC